MRYRSSSIFEFKDRITINQGYINNTELQIVLYAYEQDGGRNITVEEVNKDLGEVIKDGNASEKITDYVEWYKYNKGQHKIYSDKLQVVLIDYGNSNPDCKYKLVSSLSVEQINELINKHKNSDYNLNLE